MMRYLTPYVLLAGMATFGCSSDSSNPTPDGAIRDGHSATLDGKGSGDRGPAAESGALADAAPGHEGGTTDASPGGDAAPAWQEAFPIDRILFADWSWVTRVKSTAGQVWLPGSSRLQGQIYFAEPVALKNYTLLSPTTMLYQYDKNSGAGAYGEQGAAAEYHLKTSLHDVTIAWDSQAGFGYVPTAGFDRGIGVKAFGDPDTLEFSTTGVTASASIPAPPPLDPATFFGAQAGLDTTIRLKDGTFDLIIIALRLKGGTKAERLYRYLRPSDMSLEGDLRVAPIMDTAALAAAAQKGLTPDEPTGPMTAETLAISVLREKRVDAVGPAGRAVPVYAGHVYKMEEPLKELTKP